MATPLLRGRVGLAVALPLLSLMGLGQDSCEATFDYAGSIHSEPGVCDGHPEGYAWDDQTVDAGFLDLQVRAGGAALILEGADCGETREACFGGMSGQGAAHVGNGLCDGSSSGISTLGAPLDSGWMGLCSYGDAVLAVGVDDCGNGATGCPSGFTPRGQIHVGEGSCDGLPNGRAWDGRQIDSGWLFLCVRSDAANFDVGDDSCDRL